MPLTPLHLALGRNPSDFTFDMVEEAVEERVEETDRLDWKEALPHKNAKDEFAKDVAAMANSGGGMIVYGIREDPGPSSAAVEACGVDGWGDGEQRRLRQIAYSGIQPPVHGLIFHAVERDEILVVALTVPSSPDNPHLVWNGQSFVAPIRYGAQTEFMRERDLERAYRVRFEGRDSLTATLNDRISQLTRGLDVAERVWVIGTAMPLQPRPSHLGRIERQVIIDLLLEYMPRNPFTANRTGGRQLDVNPRAGFRRWRSIDRNERGEIESVAEFHDDGGVSLAVPNWLNASSGFKDNHVHIKHIQDIAADFVWLVALAARRLAVDNAYALRVTLTTGLPDPVYIRAFDPFGNPRDLNSLSPITQFIPVDVTVDPGAVEAELLESVRELATDMVNQGGIAKIGNTYIRTAMDAEN